MWHLSTYSVLMRPVQTLSCHSEISLGPGLPPVRTAFALSVNENSTSSWFRLDSNSIVVSLRSPSWRSLVQYSWCGGARCINLKRHCRNMCILLLIGSYTVSVDFVVAVIFMWPMLLQYSTFATGNPRILIDAMFVAITHVDLWSCILSLAYV